MTTTKYRTVKPWTREVVAEFETVAEAVESANSHYPKLEVVTVHYVTTR